MAFALILSIQSGFNPEADLVSLHYDHAPDKDDGQSAAADRTILQSVLGLEWFKRNTVAVSGAYGMNASQFNFGSNRVMDAVFGPGRWLSAHQDWNGAVGALAERWSATLQAGGDIWVKEGGQSDLTAAVVRKIREEMPEVDTKERIHVVQHSNWNEEKTRPSALSYVKARTDYIRIRDANAYLNRLGGDPAFQAAAMAHSVFGPLWKSAFEYYDPAERLDFSDTGELMFILGLGELDIDAFRQRFLTH